MYLKNSFLSRTSNSTSTFKRKATQIACWNSIVFRIIYSRILRTSWFGLLNLREWFICRRPAVRIHMGESRPVIAFIPRSIYSENGLLRLAPSHSSLIHMGVIIARCHSTRVGFKLCWGRCLHSSHDRTSRLLSRISLLDVGLLLVQEVASRQIGQNVS